MSETWIFNPQQPAPPVELHPQSGLVPTWSFSTLSNFEECAYRVFLSKVQKEPDVKGAAADRGTAIHKLAEDYTTGALVELPKELVKFDTKFKALQLDFADGKVEVEQDWGFDTDWSPTGWNDDNVWGRMKLDSFVREDETGARLIDVKSGKKFGNELKHGQQGQIYSVGAFTRYPELEFIQTEFWYVDHGSETIREYTRERAMLFMLSINHRALALTTATEFRPSPSRSACRWCPHQQTGVCEWAVK